MRGDPIRAIVATRLEPTTRSPDGTARSLSPAGSSHRQMPIILVCPTCNATTPVDRPSVPDACAECYQPFPEPARRAVEQALSRDDGSESPRPARPFLLTFGIGLAAFWGVKALLFSVVGAVIASPLGNTVGKTSSPPPLVVLSIAVLAAIQLAVAYGLWKERGWSRPLILLELAWAAIIVVAVKLAEPSLPDALTKADPALAERVAQGARMNAIGAFALVAVPSVLVVLYLYGKRNVRAYYASLEPERVRRTM